MTFDNLIILPEH